MWGGNIESLATCPFCSPDAARITEETPLAFAAHDAFPVTPGHTLIIPRRHFADFFDLTPEERAAVMQLLSSARERLLRERRPDGFNVGINVGAAAGQTVWHVHVHMIPRYTGDVAEPRGGVRAVIPGKAAY